MTARRGFDLTGKPIPRCYCGQAVYSSGLCYTHKQEHSRLSTLWATRRVSTAQIKRCRALDRLAMRAAAAPVEG